MIKDIVLNRIKSRKDEFKNFHVKTLYLFGSVARNEETETSDIDILVVFEGLPSFDRYMDLKFFLEDLLERKVDLVTEAAIRERVRKYIEEDLVRAA